MAMQLCPACGELCSWNSHFQKYICSKCKQKAIDDFQSQHVDEGEFYETSEMICPYCGNRVEPDGQSELYEDGETTATCGNCNSEFDVEVYVLISYTTRKKVG